MEVYDILMLAILIGATLFGAYKGFAWQIASLGSIFFSYFVAMQFRGSVARLIAAEPPWNTVLAMLILYLATSFAIWLAFRAISKTIDELKLKSFDRHIGGLLGAAKGVFLCVLITLFSVSLLQDTQRESIIRSRSGGYIALLLDKVHPVIPDEIHNVLHPYLHRLDSTIGESDPRHNSQRDTWHHTEGSERDLKRVLESIDGVRFLSDELHALRDPEATSP